MCGIGGIVRFDGAPVDVAALGRMVDALRHRGPDDERVWTDGPVGFAHTRLSVIDLSAAGSQPMHLEEPRLSIVYNGEIYNHRQLPRELEARGRRFRSSSDTEVILHAYAAWGADCVTRLRGMFAFVIWELAARRVFAARDRLGIKPLYYLLSADEFVFGSEVKTVLAARGRPLDLDPAALGDYLAFGFIPLARTPFRGMAKLPPAHVLEVERGTVRTRRYWDLDFTRRDSGSVEAPEEVLRAIEDAVRSHLVSDVPVGAFLSGGIDSSAIVTIMRDATGDRLKTFSVGFDDGSYDERPFARIVAGSLGTEHHEVICTPRDFATLWPETVWHADGLAADVSNIPLFMLARAARQHVPVVLSGDGGDELFGGYPTYKADRLAAIYRRLPLPARALVGAVVRALPMSTDKLSVEYRLRQFVRGVEDGDLSRSHFAWRRIFTAAEREALLLPDVRAAARSDTDDRLATLVRTAPADTDLQRAIYADLKTFLVDSILAKVDAMTMAHGLEARVPLLDHEIVELAARIPDRLKLSLKRGKKIFRTAMRGRVPAEVLARRKSPFQPPLAAWLKSELRDTVSDVLGARSIGALGLFDPVYVERLKHEHFAGTANHAFKLWNLVHFVEWHRLFARGEWTARSLDGQPAAVATEARH